MTLHLHSGCRSLILVSMVVTALAAGSDARAQRSALYSEPGFQSVSLETIVPLVRGELDAFWRREFGAQGWTYRSPVEVRGYAQPIQTACGALELGNAFYCKPARSVYYDVNLLRTIYEDPSFGDFGVATVLAHEWGHAVQHQLPPALVPTLPLQQELQADCFAGAFARYLSLGESSRLRLENGDLAEGASFLFSIGDDLPWFDPRAHGSPQERAFHFVIGLAEGMRGSFPSVTYQDRAFSIQCPGGWTTRYDEGWSQDGATYQKTFLMAPPYAERSELYGYLSDGIRIQFALPRRGIQWTQPYQLQWASSFVPNCLAMHPGFGLMDSYDMTFAGLSARRHVIQGSDHRISEQERTELTILTAPGYLLSVEMASSVRRDPYNQLRIKGLLESFQVGTPVAPHW